jgi:hypothetical protein
MKIFSIIDQDRSLEYAATNIDIPAVAATIPDSPAVKVAGRSGFLGQCYIGSTVLVERWNASVTPPPQPGSRRSVAFIGSYT